MSSPSTGMPTQSKVIVQTRSERIAEEWCEDSDVASEMKARLEGNGV
jgi:hypothetical protein